MNSKCDQKITSFDDVTRDIQHGTCVPTIHVSSEKQAEKHNITKAISQSDNSPLQQNNQKQQNNQRARSKESLKAHICSRYRINCSD